MLKIVESPLAKKALSVPLPKSKTAKTRVVSLLTAFKM